MAIRPWENCDNSQVQGDLFVVQSLCNGKVKGLSEVLAVVGFKARPSQSTALKLSTLSLKILFLNCLFFL